MTNYVNLKTVLRLIPKHLFTQTNENEFYIWMIDGLRLVPNVARTEPKIKIFELVNGKLNLPTEIKHVNMVSWMSEDCCDNNIQSLSDCVLESEGSDYSTENICRYTIAYKMFLDSDYFNKNFIPLKYTGTASNIFVNDCYPNRFIDSNISTFTIDKNKVLYTSSDIDDGYLAIDYDTDILNDDGDILIPDVQELQDYLAKYAMYRHWQERASIKEEAAFQMYQAYQRETEIAFKKAKGEIMLRNADVNTIFNLYNGNYRKYLKIPETFIYARYSR